MAVTLENRSVSLAQTGKIPGIEHKPFPLGMGKEKRIHPQAKAKLLWQRTKAVVRTIVSSDTLAAVAMTTYDEEVLEIKPREPQPLVQQKQKLKEYQLRADSVTYLFTHKSQ